MRKNIYGLKLFFFLLGMLLSTTITLAQLTANFTYEADGGSGSLCAPLNVVFTNTSSADVVIFEWSVDGNAFSNEENPIRTFANAGSYQVCLTVENGAGQTNQSCQNIEFFDPPTINLTFTQGQGCDQKHVDFTISSTVAMDSVSWDFGDGAFVKLPASGTSTTNSHDYSASGSFTVLVTVYDIHACDVTTSAIVNIQEVSSPSFSASSQTGCTLPYTVDFTNTTTPAGPGMSFLWDFGDGNTSTAINPSHTYQNFGSYTIQLTATNTQTGCSDQITLTDHILIGDIVDFGFDEVFNGDCGSTEINFYNWTPGALSSVLWDFGDGNTSTQTNPNHTYTTPGCYFPTLTITTSDGCNASKTATDCIQVIGNITLDYTTSGNLTSCNANPGLNLSFSASTNQPAQWQWDFGGLGISNLQNPNFTFNQYGIFPIRLTATYANGCSEMLVKDTVVIEPLGPSISADTTEGCAPLTVQFSSELLSSEPIQSYSWDFGFTTSSLANPMISFTDSGTYDVVLIVESVSGCRDSIRIEDYIQVGIPPTLSFSAEPMESCMDTSITFTNTSSTFADEWFWEFGDNGTSDLATPMHEYNDTGYFDVTLIGWFNGCSDTLIVPDMILIHPPKAAFVVFQDCDSADVINFLDSSVGADEWEWDFGDGNTSTEASPRHVYASSGTYEVSMRVRNLTSGCEDVQYSTVIVSGAHPEFSMSSNLICAGDTIQVINTSTGAENYFFNFPVGVGMIITSLNDPEPGFYFPTPGKYSGFSLTITDAIGCDSTYVFPDTITVSGVDVNFVSDIANGCPPLDVAFTSTIQTHFANVSTYSWDFGDGNTSSDPNPTHTYAAEGLYPVSLTVTNSEGCATTHLINNAINVAYPVASFVSTINSFYCFFVSFFSTATGGTLTYDWDFGDGNTSTTDSPQHTYAAAGNYTVCLNVSNGPGCEDQFCEDIEVSELIAGFSGDNLYKSCANPPLVTHFTDESVNAVSWEWDFGDGTGISTLQNPTHAYSQAGNFTVCLITTGPLGCRDTLCRNDYVQIDGPTGSFNGLPGAGCAPLAVSFTATGTNVAIYGWDFGDGTGEVHSVSGGSDQVFHTYTTGGVFTPVLLIEDASGCKVPLVGEPITVESIELDFSASDSTLCEENNQAINFISLIGGHGNVLSYDWTFEGATPATSISENALGVNFANPGFYDVSLKVSTAHCQDSLIKTDFIAIHPSPQTAFNLSTDQGCEPLQIDFTDQSSIPFDQIDSWAWDFGDGNTSDQPNPSHTFSAGNYTISLTTTSDFGCSNTFTQNIMVSTSPSVIAEGGTNICIGDYAQLNANVQQGTNVSYSWTPTMGLSCSDCPSPLANPPTTTTYELIITNPNGCTASDTARVEVGPHALPIIDITPDTLICAGESISLLVSGGILPSDYSWDDSRPGLSCYESCVSPIATPTSTTTYVIQVSGLGGCIAYDSVRVSILDQNQDLLGPDRTICAGNAVQLEIATGNNPVWTPSDGLSCTNCPNPMAAPLEHTNYLLGVTTDQGCTIYDSIQINVQQADDIFAGLDTSICENMEVMFTADYDGTATWFANGLSVAGNTPNPTFLPTESTEYVLAVNNDLCTLYDTVFVELIGKPELIAQDYHLCEGDSVWLEVGGDATHYQWSPDEGLSQTDMSFVLASPAQSTTYQVLGAIGDCEADTVYVNVEIVQSAGVEIIAKDRFKLGESVQIHAVVDVPGSYTYDWTPPNHLSCGDCTSPIASPDSSTVYQVVVEDIYGCADSASMTLNLLTICDETALIVPTGFTPNGDGENDELRVLGDSEMIIFRVFNRWGEVVFESDDPTRGWNGTYNGELLNRDVFIYYVEGRCRFDGSIMIRTGDVTLIR